MKLKMELYVRIKITTFLSACGFLIKNLPTGEYFSFSAANLKSTAAVNKISLGDLFA
jgi:outer membrane lipopolysaccharide assembly protein LptE/RlpB